jgi:hypothetical protein
MIDCPFMDISQLDSINRYRARTQQVHYKDERSAVTKNGTTKKQKLTVSPFSCANDEGYWTCFIVVGCGKPQQHGHNKLFGDDT